ncbi:MAG: endonuclease/exonuclease/phosphatase family protein [Polyangiaceae bacterium]|nr:endonuclease/exonuclease/phosphatase family protein [Polyangiaceae bacterium]
MRLFFACRFSLALALGLSSLGCGEPIADDLDFDRQAVPIFRSTARPEAPPPPKELRVMAWNIKYGAARIDFWFDLWGDRVHMQRAEVEGNLSRIYALIREVDPDVLVTEEIEVNSQRSAYVDMVQGILNHTSLGYAAYIQTWNSRYVPSEGLGRMDMGNAIFSKYPILSAERIRQVDRTDIDALTRMFYLHRMVGRAVIDVGRAQPLAAYVVHTEAYDKDGTKGRHIQQIFDLLSAETLPFVIGGDFNELPPRAVKLSNFPDENPRAKGTDYEQPPYVPAQMQKFYDNFEPAIPLSEYGDTEELQRKYFSHSVIGPATNGTDGKPGFWNRTLDYLFASKGQTWATGKSDVLQTSGRQGISADPLYLSDHAPVVGTLQLDASPEGTP